MESEEDLGLQDSSVYSKAVIWGTDWTAETIVNQLRKKNIDLNPDFQRRDAWDPTKKSKFIESLILGLPVPPIILAERKDRKNSYLVIDGKQRLLTIMQFCAKEEDEGGFERLFLNNLEILTELNGFNYSKMLASNSPSGFIDQFDNQAIRTVVIRNWPNEQFLYTVFLRLNTGSLKLSPQELRQALHPGEFLTYVNKYSETQNPIWDLLRLKKPDSRMRDVELIIRYFAFKNFAKDYKNSLKDFLDDACSLINIDWNQNSKKYKEQLLNLENAIVFSKEIFGEKNTFTKFINGEYTGIFNRTIFDIMVFYFSEEKTREKLKNNKANIKSLFEELMMNNKSFVDSVSGSTKDGEKTSTRFRLFGESLVHNPVHVGQ
jgi:uncharacterized protein with ParB-like and HNH nuclease domain